MLSSDFLLFLSSRADCPPSTFARRWAIHYAVGPQNGEGALSCPTQTVLQSQGALNFQVSFPGVAGPTSLSVSLCPLLAISPKENVLARFERADFLTHCDSLLVVVAVSGRRGELDCIPSSKLHHIYYGTAICVHSISSYVLSFWPFDSARE